MGCALLASVVALALNSLLAGRRDEWGLDRVYGRRSDMDDDARRALVGAVSKFDCIAFGLGFFRSVHGRLLEECLRRGVSVRILAMDPEGRFVGEREDEEGAGKGHIRKSVEDLVSWADSLNRKGYAGSVEVRGYSCMTLDFYWRLDDEMYVGPYWYGRQGHSTVTFRFSGGGKGFGLYAGYFKELWNDSGLCRVLTGRE